MKNLFLIISLMMMLVATPVFAGDVNTIAGAGVDFNYTPTTYADEPRQLPMPVPVFPNPIPLIQGGRVGDITVSLPGFAYVGLRPLGNGDKVLDLVVKSGSIFDRVRLEDIELDVIKFYKKTIEGKKWNETMVRYAVQYKDSAMGAGIGGGGASSVSGLGNGATAVGGTGSLAVLPGYTRSTADPVYVIKLYLIGSIASLNIKTEAVVPEKVVKKIKPGEIFSVN